MSRPTEELLEFDRLKEIASGFTTCAPGRRAILALAPWQDADALRGEFALIAEANACLRAGSELGFGALADPEEWLARLTLPGAVLSTEELLQAATLMEAAGAVRQIFRNDEESKYPQLASLATALVDFRSLLAAIRRAVLANGEIGDEASAKLKRVRGNIAGSRQEIRSSLERVLRSRGEPSGEDYVTLRNDRFVIPVRASERRTVPGVVHAASATGQTVFVEPLDTIDLNNRLVQLLEEETAEIARILEALTSQVLDERAALANASDTVAHLDAIFARARFAREFDCVMPEFTAEHRLDLKSARNPVLEAALRPQGRKAVPLSLVLGGPRAESSGTESQEETATVLVISGPNTGGKTVALKTVGLAALSAQSGIPVAAESAVLPTFDRVLADIGDEQSIAADLSTFSAHMLNLKSMLENATSSSLILVDEMGTGTAPEEGAALAIALLEEFRERGAITLATTHHDRLKTYASTTPGVLNAAMEFDERILQPTYRLLVGVPGTSSGIEIARRLGLPARAIERSEAELSPEAREARELIAYLHRTRDEIETAKIRLQQERSDLETERRTLRGEWVERQKKRIAELERDFAEVEKSVRHEIERSLAEIKDNSARVQLEKQSAKRAIKILSHAREEANAAVVGALGSSQSDLGVPGEVAEKPFKPEQLSPGERVFVKRFKQPVIFRGSDGSVAEVEAGPLRMKVPVTEIIGIEIGAQPGTGQFGSGRGRSGVSIRFQTSDAAASGEINVIGCTVEEATERVDKFLDEAALAGKPSVRIIHGYGTGALRRGLAEFLSSHPLVERIHAEAEERGGNAVTVAELQS